MLLPAMPRRYSLLKLGQMKVPRLMVEDLTPVIDKAEIGRLGRGPTPTLVGYVKLSWHCYLVFGLGIFRPRRSL